MAQPSTRKLKVFQAQLGFYDSVVAAPSQTAALRAWGIRQNLFADGSARLTDDPQAVQAALAHPQTPLKRAVGSSDPFGLEAALPKVPDAPKLPKPAKAIPPAAAKTSKPRADRSKLEGAEARLRKLDDDRKREEAQLRREQEALERRREGEQASYVERRKAATADVVAARTAYRGAGGED